MTRLVSLPLSPALSAFSPSPIHHLPRPPQFLVQCCGPTLPSPHVSAAGSSNDGGGGGGWGWGIGVRRAVVGAVVALGFVCAPSPLAAIYEESARAGAGVVVSKQTQGGAVADASSSVESILARQLARRFREMSDEELAQVLEQLLRASKSFTVLSGDRLVSGQESLGESVGAGLEKRSTTRAGRSEAESDSTNGGVDKNPAGVELRQDSEATTTQRKEVQANKSPANIPQSGVDSPASDDATPRPQVLDRVRSGLAGEGKASGDEQDLTVLLWKELQKRVDASSGARDLAKDMSSSNTNSNPQGLFRDPIAVAGVLAVNAALIIGQWKFLELKNEKQAANQDQKSKGRSAVDSDQLGKNSGSGKKSDQNPSRSIWTGMADILYQVQNVGKKKSPQGQLPGEDKLQKPRSEGWGLETSSRSKDDLPFHERLASIRKVSTERQRQGEGSVDLLPVLQKRVSRAPETRKDEFQVKSAERSMNKSNKNGMRDPDDDVGSRTFPSTPTYRTGRESEIGSPGYGRGRLETLSVDEQDQGEEPPPAYTNHDKNLIVGEEVSISSRPSLKSPTRKGVNKVLTGVGNGENDLRSRISGRKRLEERPEADSNNLNKQRWVQKSRRSKDDARVNINGGYNDCEDRNREEINLLKVGPQDSSMYKQIQVDFWASTAESAGLQRVTDKPYSLLEKGEDIYEDVDTVAADDQFTHRGVLWTRDKDGVFVKQLNSSSYSLPVESIAKGRKHMNHEERSQMSVNGMKVKDTGLKTSNLEYTQNTRDGRFRDKNRRPFDYRQLVLRQGKKDILLEKFGSSQSESISRRSVPEKDPLQVE